MADRDVPRRRARRSRRAGAVMAALVIGDAVLGGLALGIAADRGPDTASTRKSVVVATVPSSPPVNAGKDPIAADVAADVVATGAPPSTASTTTTSTPPPTSTTAPAPSTTSPPPPSEATEGVETPSTTSPPATTVPPTTTATTAAPGPPQPLGGDPSE